MNKYIMNKLAVGFLFTIALGSVYAFGGLRRSRTIPVIYFADAAATDTGIHADAAAADAGNPLIDHVAGLDCKWNWANSPDAGPWNPIVAAGGASGTGCNLDEHPTPNWAAAKTTAGLTAIAGLENHAIDNGTSGGWGQGTLSLTTHTGGDGMIRALVKTPSALTGSKTILEVWGETDGEVPLAYMTLTTASTTLTCQYDDGSGVISSATRTLSTSTWYLLDCKLDPTTHKVTLCANNSCATAATASGSSSFAGIYGVGLMSLQANGNIWNGQALEIHWFTTATWWSTTVHGTDCALIISGC